MLLRQKPGSAKAVMFITTEDGTGVTHRILESQAGSGIEVPIRDVPVVRHTLVALR